MTVTIQPNMYRPRLLIDLAKIVPSTQLSVDLFGTVAVTNPTTVMGQLLHALTQSSVRVLLVGDEGGSKFVLNGQVVELRGVGGITQADANPATVILVGYDVTQCYGNGYQVRGSDGSLIPFPGHVLLAHELAHAAQITSGQFTTVEAAERFAVTEENKVRKLFGLPLRDVSSFPALVDGGCAAPPPKPATPPRSSGCFLAMAALGTGLQLSVVELRKFREEALRSSRYGRAFWDEFFPVYANVSQPIVQAMEDDPRVRELTRWAIVTPLVHYLRIARMFPDADPSSADEPWRTFLIELRTMLSEFAEPLPLPYDLGGVPPAEAASDIAIALRFILRDEDSRQTWLRDLRQRGQIPLSGNDTDLAEARRVLRRAGIPKGEIHGLVPRHRVGAAAEGDTLGVADPAPPALTGFGKVHVATSAPADRSRWIYTVTLRNSTTDTFQKVRCFYLVKPGNPDNMGVTEVGVINPGDVVVFPLSVCSDLLSYTLEGEFVEEGGASGTFEWPGQGPMTPARASVVNPTDTFPCEDSFQFTF
ncbi:CFI-box-CTERM domain-containing protein [Arthrobacter sp. ISL-65]|uniref:CFI-box-CTERM domain-containing protein n=1 Tax=Arthrobacter sp. ISL-65 TaxID=2819112 RepID=UPI001BE657B0|nr:CFI-box-CTERM domain-containing protein [Arthrobacter sp. ISL-65]MBT2547466.1 hypothetical protein [Arthrobacter sp. ISL-65]